MEFLGWNGNWQGIQIGIGSLDDQFLIATGRCHQTHDNNRKQLHGVPPLGR